ncbi:RIP metalloprotease RseP [Tateyamaria sp.]|nr:RIP metalloprotease RseP [Tateyamaria sp.]
MDILTSMPAFGGFVFVWTIFFFVIALSVIVAIHEYGHYIVGRWSGIHADVFSIGFGPVLYRRKDKRGTYWQIAALPFGGFVKFAGDADASSGKDVDAMADAAKDPVKLRQTMHGAPLWARTVTVAAGPIFNFVFSVIIFTLLGYSNGIPRDPLIIGNLPALPVEFQELQEGDLIISINGVLLPKIGSTFNDSFLNELPKKPVLDYTVNRNGTEVIARGPYLQPALIGAVSPKSAALAAGLLPGDVVMAVNDQPIFSFTQLKSAVEGSDGKSLDLSVWRDGLLTEKILTPRKVDVPQSEGGFTSQWRIGVASANAFEAATEAPDLSMAITDGVIQTWSIISGSISGLRHIITGAISPCNLSGPVSIAQVSGTMASQGALPFITWIAILSTAVGLMNLFPIPALDGGHLVFYAYEGVTGRPPSDRALRVLMGFGFVFIISLMVFAFGNDVYCLIISKWFT